MIGPTVSTWDDWKDVYTDQNVWMPVIQEILKREAIPYNKIEKGYPGTSAVFIIDQSYVLKIYPGPFISDHEREWPVLTLLEDLYHHPILIASGTFEDENMMWPYAIMPYIEGKAYREIADRLSVNEEKEFFTDLAKTLQHIHSLPVESLLNHPAYQWLSSDDIKEQLENVLDLPFFKNEAFRKNLYSFVENVKEELEQQDMVFVHGDLTDDHLLFKKEDGNWKFRDVIDWGDAHIAPVFYDFVVLWVEVFHEKPAAWESFISLYNESYNTKSDEFRRLFTGMLIFHPFACDLISYVYHERGSKDCFLSVSSFMTWLFNE